MLVPSIRYDMNEAEAEIDTNNRLLLFVPFRRRRQRWESSILMLFFISDGSILGKRYNSSFFPFGRFFLSRARRNGLALFAEHQLKFIFASLTFLGF